MCRHRSKTQADPGGAFTSHLILLVRRTSSCWSGETQRRLAGCPRGKQGCQPMSRFAFVMLIVHLRGRGMSMCVCVQKVFMLIFCDAHVDSLKEQLNHQGVARDMTDNILAEATVSSAAIDSLHSVWPPILRCFVSRSQKRLCAPNMCCIGHGDNLNQRADPHRDT